MSASTIIHLAPTLQICQQQQGNRSVFRQYTAAVVDYRHSNATSAGTDDYKFCPHNTWSHLIMKQFTNHNINWLNTFVLLLCIHRDYLEVKFPRKKQTQENKKVYNFAIIFIHEIDLHTSKFNMPSHKLNECCLCQKEMHHKN